MDSESTNQVIDLSAYVGFVVAMGFGLIGIFLTAMVRRITRRLVAWVRQPFVPSTYFERLYANFSLDPGASQWWAVVCEFRRLSTETEGRTLKLLLLPVRGGGGSEYHLAVSEEEEFGVKLVQIARRNVDDSGSFHPTFHEIDDPRRILSSRERRLIDRAARKFVKDFYVARLMDVFRSASRPEESPATKSAVESPKDSVESKRLDAIREGQADEYVIQAAAAVTEPSPPPVPVAAQCPILEPEGRCIQVAVNGICVKHGLIVSAQCPILEPEGRCIQVAVNGICVKHGLVVSALRKLHRTGSLTPSKIVE